MPGKRASTAETFPGAQGVNALLGAFEGPPLVDDFMLFQSWRVKHNFSPWFIRI